MFVGVNDRVAVSDTGIAVVDASGIAAGRHPTRNTKKVVATKDNLREHIFPSHLNTSFFSSWLPGHTP